jgi:acyl-CoA thioesterase II
MTRTSSHSIGLTTDGLALEPGLRLSRVGSNRFRCAYLIPNMSRGVFGGQLVANALGACLADESPLAPYSIQVLFLRPGKLTAPIDYVVENLHDGSRIAEREVRAYQDDRLLITAHVSLCRPRNSFVHQMPPEGEYAEPESLEDFSSLVERHRSEISVSAASRLQSKKAVLIKPVDSDFALLRKSPDPRLAFWLKPATALSAERSLHYCAVAFLSDNMITIPCQSSHRAGLFGADSAVPSLNHALYFHADPVVDDWMLYCVDSPAAGHGIGFARGQMYSRSGQLVASAAQQGLMPVLEG